jgi:hypothetical protein
VAGDTASDIESGRRAGAAIVAGVLTGASTRADLEQAGAPLILDTIADLLPYVFSLPDHSPREGTTMPILARQVGMMASQDEREVASLWRAGIGWRSA